MTDVYGLIGHPLEHSFSPAYFAEKFRKEKINAVYKSFALKDIFELPALLLEYPDIRGLNVTIPYKTTVIPYLNELSAEAQNIGAVNCVSLRNGKRKGFNTDALGFEKTLQPLLKPHHKKALVLGTGGSARAVKYVLEKLGISYTFVSRQKKQNAISYAELNDDIMRDHLLIINATPAGMFPHVEDCPNIRYETLTQNHLLYDLVYNPAETKFLLQGKEKGAVVKNGLDMLHVQAEESWRIWTSG